MGARPQPRCGGILRPEVVCSKLLAIFTLTRRAEPPTTRGTALPSNIDTGEFTTGDERSWRRHITTLTLLALAAVSTAPSPSPS